MVVSLSIQNRMQEYTSALSSLPITQPSEPPITSLYVFLLVQAERQSGSNLDGSHLRPLPFPYPGVPQPCVLFSD